MFTFPTKYNAFHSLSDHMPQIYSTVKFGDIISWNILYKCTYNNRHHYYNNGFGYVESTNEYYIRLDNIAKKIVSLISENPNINIIALQELPKLEKDFEYFKDILSNKLKAIKGKEFIIDKVNLSRPQDNLVIFNSIELQGNNLTNNITHIKLDKQADNFQFFQFHNKEQKKLCLINVHLYWFVPHSADFYSSINDIRKLITYGKQLSETKQDLIICGDFNLDLKLTGLDKEFLLHSKDDTTLAYKTASAIQVFESVDGFIHSVV